MRRVEVKWTDAHGDAASWTPISDLTSDHRQIRTTGYLLPGGTKQGHLSVAQSWDKRTGHVDSVIHIPIACVQTVRRLP
jgi:hypothetical protein